jgi:hypothetical protein
VVFLDKGINLTQKLVAHDAHRHRRSHRLPTPEPEKTSGLFFHLQRWLIDVEVQPIKTFGFQGQVVTQDFGNTAWYTHGWLQSTPILRDHHRLERANKMGLREQTPHDRLEPFQ